MPRPAKNETWSTIKNALKGWDAARLTELVHDLYQAGPENRRFLHARLVGAQAEIEKYRQLVEDALYPNPCGNKPVRIGEARRIVQHFRQATGDQAATLDLMLTFVEAGTRQAADLGYGNDSYFRSLENMLGDAVAILSTLPMNERDHICRRMKGIATLATSIGWGYGDTVNEIVDSKLEDDPACRDDAQQV